MPDCRGVGESRIYSKRVKKSPFAGFVPQSGITDLNESDSGKLISKEMVHGFPPKLSRESMARESCILGKQVSTPFPEVSKKRCE